MQADLHTSLLFVKLKVSHDNAILMHCGKSMPTGLYSRKQATVWEK